MDLSCNVLFGYLNNGMIGMKSKGLLKKARKMYVEDDIDGSVIELAKALALGSEVAALSLQFMLSANLNQD